MSISAASRSSTRSTLICSSAQTCSAMSRLQPAKTDSRRSRICSSGVERGQGSSRPRPAASAAAAARCGPGGQQAEPVVDPRRDLLGGQRPDARGRKLDGQRDPSSVRHSWMTGRICSGQREARPDRGGAVGEQLDGLVLGRGRQRPGLLRGRRHAPPAPAGPGRESGGTRHTVSPRTRSGSRLVATSRSCGARRSGLAPGRRPRRRRARRCRVISSSRLPRSASTRVAAAGRSGSSRDAENVGDAVARSRAGSAVSASSTSQMPSGKSSLRWPAKAGGKPGLADAAGAAQCQRARTLAEQ